MGAGDVSMRVWVTGAGRARVRATAGEGWREADTGRAEARPHGPPPPSRLRRRGWLEVREKGEGLVDAVEEGIMQREEGKCKISEKKRFYRYFIVPTKHKKLFY